MALVKPGAAFDDLHKALQNLYKNGPDSAADLLLVYGDKSKMVQSWLFCARSDFFKTATHGGLKEAQTREIHLHDNDPFMVERLIQHCYAIDYSDSKAIQDDWKESHYIPELQIHSRMYAIADRYSIEDLRKEAKLKFHYAIHRDSDEYDHDDEYEDNGIAERHDVLKVLPHVYNSRPSSAHGLRTIVFNFALDHWEWFEQQSEVLKNAPREFLVDIDHAIGHLTMDKPAWLRDVLET